MDAPARPVLLAEPGSRHVIGYSHAQLQQALTDLYEAAFANGDRRAAMDSAHSAFSAIVAGLHEALSLRQRIDGAAAPPPYPPLSPLQAITQLAQAESDCRLAQKLWEQSEDRLAAIRAAVERFSHLPPGEPVPALAQQIILLVGRLASDKGSG